MTESMIKIGAVAAAGAGALQYYENGIIDPLILGGVGAGALAGHYATAINSVISGWLGDTSMKVGDVDLMVLGGTIAGGTAGVMFLANADLMTSLRFGVAGGAASLLVQEGKEYYDEYSTKSSTSGSE